MSLPKFIALAALAIFIGSASGIAVHVAFQIGFSIGFNSALQKQ